LRPPRLNRVGLHRLTAGIALAHGDLAAAAEAIEDLTTALGSAAFNDEQHLPRAQLEAELLLARGQLDAALTVVSDALGQFHLMPNPRYAWPLLVAGACVYVAAPAADGAALGERLQAEAAKLDVEGRTQRAHQLTFTALMSTVPTWAAAVQAWEATAEPYPLARVLLNAASAALDAGDRDGAGGLLHRAAALAQDLGAHALTGQIAGLAQRGRIALGPAPGPVADHQAGLTARELEVLRLVAAGRSNRDIAADLFISPKTASVHVSNILGKLGVTSRGEAAAAAYRLGLS
jgi:DNA-binding NarL/FixJ family response regulator